MFDRTSGTEQLQFRNSGETCYAAIAVLPTDNIAVTVRLLSYMLSQTNPVDLQMPKLLKVISDMILLIYN